MKRILTFIIIYALIVSQAFAIPFIDRHEAYKYGNGTTSTKTFEYDFGLGVLNPKMQVDNSQGFVFDKALSSQGLTSPSLSVTGTGTATFSGKGLFLDDLTGKDLKASGNALTIGDGAASNKSITFDKGAGASNPFMKWDESQAALVYSNDGTLIKKIGSGSGGGDGGGVNFLKNGGFEDLKANWTESGGTFTAEAFTTGIESDLKFGQWVATSASQTLCSDLVATPSFANAGGMFDLAYTASGSQFLIYVKDGSGNKLTSDQSLLDQTAWAKLSPIPFSFNTSQKLCFESKSAATLKLNNVYMGTNKGVGSVSHAKHLGQIKWPTTTGCYWSGGATAVGSFVDIPANASCPTPIVTGSLLAPDTKQVGFKLGTVQKGKYLIKMNSFLYNSGSAGIAHARFSSGALDSNTAPIPYLSSQNFQGVDFSISFGLMYSNQTFLLQVNRGNTNPTPVILNDDYIKTTTIDVYFFPDEAESVQTTEASQWFIDANIGSTANIGLGAGAVTSYTEITSNDQDLVLRNGSSTAQIACASGTDSSGLTCTSNESVGVTFTNPYTGYYEACADFSNTTMSQDIFQLVETTPTSSAIIQEGGSRMESYNGNTATVGSPLKVCGTFLFNNSQRRTIRLMYEKASGSSALLSDRSTSYGQRDIHITVRPLLQNSLRAILTGDQVRSKDVVKPHSFNFVFGDSTLATNCSSGTCGLFSIGGEVTSVNWLSAGVYRAFFDRTFSKVICTGIGHISGTGVSLAYPDYNSSFSCVNCSSMNMTFVNTASNATNTLGNVSCMAQE